MQDIRGCLVVRAELVREGFLEEIDSLPGCESQPWIQFGACIIGPQVATPSWARKLPGLASCVSYHLRARSEASGFLLSFPGCLRAVTDYVALAAPSVLLGFQKLKMEPRYLRSVSVAQLKCRDRIPDQIEKRL